MSTSSSDASPPTTMPAETEGEAPQGSAPFRVFFIPFFAPSHTYPMVELACQFAARGVDSTVLVTPANGDQIRSTVDRACRAGHPIRMLFYPFPSAEVGLPEGVENMASVPAAEMRKILTAAHVAPSTHDRILREHRPDAVVVDFPYNWADDVVRDPGIPRVLYHVFGAFPLVVMGSLIEHRPHAGLADGDNGSFLVPGLPDRVEVVKSESQEIRFWDRIRKSQLECFGVIVNTFYELEPAYCDLFRRTECQRAWFCGPCTLWPRDDQMDEEAAAAAAAAAATEEKGGQCIAWLDKQATASVVYVGFGSFLYFSKEQHWEMARGLEASGRPFLWVLKESNFAGGGEDWLPEGFEERVKLRGCSLVTKGWVPQTAILNHPAVGAFVTHLGWNSMTEGLNAGLPMITYPLAFEQFFTERMVVDVLRIGLRMCDGFCRKVLVEAEDVSDVKRKPEPALVKGEAIARVVSRFVAPGSADEEVEAIRKRAGEYGAMLRAAVREGGSSYADLGRLIDALKAFRPV